MTGHPAVEKAKKLARIAVENGWKGSIEHDAGTTLLAAWRENEQISVRWNANTMEFADHVFMGHISQLPCAKAVLRVLEGLPDIMMVLKYAPVEQRPALVEKYRNLPFDWENDDDEEIIASLLGRQINWYSSVSTRIHSDVVLPPKTKKSKHIEIKPVAHRKMLNFVGQQGFRSVLLDTILKVG